MTKFRNDCLPRRQPLHSCKDQSQDLIARRQSSREHMQRMEVSNGEGSPVPDTRANLAQEDEGVGKLPAQRPETQARLPSPPDRL